MLSALTGRYGPKAQLNGSNLIISLPDAVTPTIWNLNLDQIQTVSLRLEMDENGLFMILFDQGDNDGADILASYHRRGPAVRAMMRASHAMGKYQKPTSQNTLPKRKGLLKPLIVIVAVLFVLWLILSAFMSALVPPPNTEQDLRALLGQQPEITNIPQLAPRVDPNSNGVAIPLEDFLNRPQQPMP